MAAADVFANLKPWNWLRPHTKIVAGDSLKSDTVDLQDSADATCQAQIPTGFSISVAGTVKLTLRDGTIVSFVSGGLTPGVVYDLRVKRLWSTGNAATGCMLWFK